MDNNKLFTPVIININVNSAENSSNILGFQIVVLLL